ncbi:hypothetical protein [Tabrizicola sp.]|uniref:hypothetical protein n=1 Tax=Tabrizicola sp. TaxID=2005166 RepID=UPI00286AC9BC|nr:hypothetical protein [Tabrizicola sp.]
MVGFFYLKSSTLTNQRDTGKKIMDLIKDVGDESEGSTWKAFKADPKAWLFEAGYEYRGQGAGPNGEIPNNLKLVPVYDTEDTMHVRIPWKGVLEGFDPDQLEDEKGYGQGPAKLPILLARYFMRKCR